MTDDAPTEGYMTAEDVARYLAVSLDWVYERAAAGDRREPGGLPSYKLGGHRRFRRTEIDEWVATQRGRATT